MAQDEKKLDLDEIEEPDDLEADDLDELDDADVVDDADLETDELETVDVVVDENEAVVVVAPPTGDDDDDEEEDDDLDPDDVEAGLDVILKDRLVLAEADEEEDEEEVPDAEERVEGPQKVLVKRPGEFVCESCFLVKHPGQLADPRRMFCRDCV